MKANEFNRIKKHAETVNIKTDDFLNCAGWFWINLTEKQLNQMVDIMEQQGETPDADGWYHLRNGLGIRRVAQ